MESKKLIGKVQWSTSNCVNCTHYDARDSYCNKEYLSRYCEYHGDSVYCHAYINGNKKHRFPQ